MDVFCDAREIGNRFGRYVIDLRRLFLFHGVACGAAENFVELAVKLEESRALRLDLPALLRNIRDLERGEISADEMLTVVALASGGEELVDGRASAAGVSRTVGLMRMMLAGVGTWAETNGVERAAQVVEGSGNGTGTGFGMGTGTGSGERAGTGTGEDRVFLELAIEELRLQLGDVTRRMRELEPRRGMMEAGLRMTAMPAGEMPGMDPAMAEMAAGAMAGSESGAGSVAVWEEPAGWSGDEARMGWMAAEEQGDGGVAMDGEAVEWVADGREAVDRDALSWNELSGAAMERAEIDRAAADRAEVDRVAMDRAEVDQAEAARVAMEQADAARAAMEQHLMEQQLMEQRLIEQRLMEAERERAATWPLEERVVTMLPVTEPATAVAENASGPGLDRSALRWSGLQRSALQWSALRGEKVRLGAVAAGLGLAMVGIYGSVRAASVGSTSVQSASVPVASVRSALVPAASVRSASLPAEKESGGAGVARAGGGAAEKETAGVGADAVPLKAERPRGVVAKGPVTKDAATKERRDGAPVEAVRGRKDGKFLFVPAEVMEKHLVSARRPVLPQNAQGGQGRVVLNAFIAKDGTVRRTDVVEGPPKLISSAMAAVSWRRYRPFLLRGKPAEVVTPVTVSYVGR